MIADLFPKNSVGRQHYLKFNDPENPTKYIEDWVSKENRSEEKLIKRG